MRGLLVPVFLQAGSEFLDQLGFQEGGEVDDAADGEEGVLEGFLGLGFLVWVEIEGFEGEGGGREVVLDGDVEAVDFVFVGKGEACDEGFGAETGDLEEVGQ